MHSARLLQYFQSSDHAGELPGANARVSLENPICGDQLVLSAQIEGDRIVAICFLARGCVAAMGTAAALCHLLQGRSVVEARQLSRQQLIDEVGGLSAASLHAAVLALDARDQVLEKQAPGS